jgi:hypothetical protein
MIVIFQNGPQVTSSQATTKVFFVYGNSLHLMIYLRRLMSIDYHHWTAMVRSHWKVNTSYRIIQWCALESSHCCILKLFLIEGEVEADMPTGAILHSSVHIGDLGGKAAGNFLPQS